MDNAKELYMNDICSFEKSERMREYYRKEFSGMCKFDDGAYIVFDKPSIETNFCFGYGMYLRSTDEEEKRASDMALPAATS